jgi:hypothetical protein
MNLLIFLAQTPKRTPSVKPRATSFALVTPTPTPTVTPFHIVMKQEPFWNSALGIFLVVVLATVVDIVTKAAIATSR